MAQSTEEFYRIQKLPPYVFAVINEMRARARAAQQDVIDLGMGNPDGATPRVVVGKMVEAVAMRATTAIRLRAASLGCARKSPGGTGRTTAWNSIPRRKRLSPSAPRTPWRICSLRWSDRAMRWSRRIRHTPFINTA